MNETRRWTCIYSARHDMNIAPAGHPLHRESRASLASLVSRWASYRHPRCKSPTNRRLVNCRHISKIRYLDEDTVRQSCGTPDTIALINELFPEEQPPSS